MSNAVFRSFRYLLPLVFLVAGAHAENRVLNLPLGDPERREQHAELVLDGITDTRSDRVLTPSELPARLAGVRLLFVGEEHISVDFHRAQLRVIQELVRAGREVLIGLEMFPYTQQAPLDHWTEGLLTEQGFLELSEWYNHWGYPWDYYRAIFETARDHGIRIYALNTPREIVRAVAQKGIDSLSEEEARHVPDRIDTASEDHLTLFRAIFEEQAEEEEDFHAMLDDEQLRAMFEAQCTWDATMAHNAVQALKQHDNPNAIMVVLVGSGHLGYGLGLQRQARQWYDGEMATIIPVGVGDICEPVTEVRASYADFIWGVPDVENPLHPYLGASTMKDGESGLRKVIYVMSDSPAEHAELALGDLLLSIGGEVIPDRATLKRLIAQREWGDRSTLVVRRGGEELSLEVYFRRERPEPCDDGDDD